MRHLHLFRWASAAALALFLAPYAGAEGLKTHYDIPAQPLAAALKNLAETGDLQLVYSPEVVAGVRSQALKGEYTPLEALDRLIAPAGLTYSYDGKDTIVVKRKPSDAQPAASDHVALRLVQADDEQAKPEPPT